MKIHILLLISSALFLSSAYAAEEAMEHMPLAKEKSVSTVTGREDFESIQGFGADAPMVRMMNLMMVGGSGYEGMDMSAVHDHEPSPAPRPELTKTGVKNTSPFEIHFTIMPEPPKTGTNRLEFTLVDRETKKPAAGLHLHAEVFMTSMDMGTETPKVEETSPGHYRVSVPFSMRGPWAVRIGSLPESETEHSRMWENLLHFDVK